MKLFDELDDKNFELYAIRSYYNPTCIDPEEFYEDLKRFKYVKRLITRYKENGNPRESVIESSGHYLQCVRYRGRTQDVGTQNSSHRRLGDNKTVPHLSQDYRKY